MRHNLYILLRLYRNGGLCTVKCNLTSYTRLGKGGGG